MIVETPDVDSIGSQGSTRQFRPKHSVRSKRVFVTSCVALMLTVSGLAHDFAALSVTPYGQQNFDLATNTTTLPQGGRVIDHDSNVVLSGEFVRYQEGVFVELKEAIVEGAFGNLAAPDIELDIDAQTLHARGQVQFDGGELVIQALSVMFFLEPDIAIVRGDVFGDAPRLEGASLIIDTESQQAILVGPYTYQDGPFTLSGQTADDILLVRWQGEQTDGSFQVTTDIDADVRERLLGFLALASI